jgi:hypothetical protein
MLRKYVIRGERLIKLDNSWFFAKSILVEYLNKNFKVEHNKNYI